VIGAVPLGSWETITFVAALRHNKMTAPMVTEGAMTGELFLAYVEQCLVPTLRRNDIVVMDNCRVHMAPAVRRAFVRRGMCDKKIKLHGSHGLFAASKRTSKLPRHVAPWDARNHCRQAAAEQISHSTHPSLGMHLGACDKSAFLIVPRIS
jgi:hypothetical protein